MASPDTTSIITGFYGDRDHAKQALAALSRLDYQPRDMSFMATQGIATPASHLTGKSPALENRALEGAVLGAAIGGILGAVLMIPATVGAMMLFPGVVIAGPIVAAFAGAGAGGLLGGLVGLVIGARFNRGPMIPFDPNAPEGGILISVFPHSEADRELIEREMVAAGGDIIHRRRSFP